MPEKKEPEKSKTPASQSDLEQCVIALDSTNKALQGLMISIAQQGILPSAWVDADLANLQEAIMSSDLLKAKLGL